MKKIIKRMITLLVCIIMMVMPVVTYADADIADSGTWAFYVYMVDNPINVSYNSRIIKEMGDVKFSNKIKVVGESSANNSLADFLKFCKNNAEADHKVLIIVGDGDGVYGLLDANNSYVTLRDIRDSLSINYEINNNEPVFDLAFIDASFMGTAELGRIFEGFAKYIVAPESRIYSSNGYYRNWFGRFASNTNISAFELGKLLIDEYKTNTDRQMIDNKRILSTNLSLFDTKLLADSFKTYTALLKNVFKRINNDNLMLSFISEELRDSMIPARVIGDSFDYNLVDFMDFMNKIKIYFPLESGRVVKAIEKAILYKVNNGFSQNLYGVSIYFPKKTFGGHNELMQEYIYTINDPYISALYTYKMNGTINEDMASIIKKEHFTKIKPIDFSVCDKFDAMNPETKGKIQFTYKLPNDLKGLFQCAYVQLYRRSDSSFISYNMNNYFDIDKNNDIKVLFDGHWATLDDAPLSVHPIEDNINYSTYYTDVYLNDEKKKLFYSHDNNDNIYKLIGTIKYNEDDPKIESAVIDLLQFGDEIVLYDTVLDTVTGTVKEIKKDAFTYNDNYKVEEKILPDGDYTFQVICEDIRGVKHQGQNILFTIINGKVGEAISEKDLYERYK